MATNTPAVLARLYPAIGATPTRFNISNKAITTNLATITTSTLHGITQVGTIVTIQGVDSTFDGVWAIHSIPTTSTFTFVSTTATVASSAVSPVGIATFNTGASGVTNGFTISNKVVQNNIATLTTSSAHNLSAGDMVTVTIGDTIYDGKEINVIATPSTTTFSYQVATASAATTAVSQGSFGKWPAVYTVPASTSTIATNIVVTNASTSASTFSIILDGNALAWQQSISANSSAYFDLKQFLATTKTITAASPSPRVNVQISGMTVV
jgi:hypothetical protein